MFVFYYCSGTNATGKGVSENRIVELLPEGKRTEAVKVELKVPLTSFMTATPRGGTKPSKVLDVLGSPSGKAEIRYARVRM
jgi:hypothetical protein